MDQKMPKVMLLKNFNKILRLLRFSYVYIWNIKGLQLSKRQKDINSFMKKVPAITGTFFIL